MLPAKRKNIIKRNQDDPFHKRRRKLHALFSKMVVRVGINGFGRIGRLSMRAAWDMPELEIVHVNEIKGGATTAAYMLQVGRFLVNYGRIHC